MTGSSTMKPSEICVRRRRSWRLSSTRTGSVRPTEKPCGVPSAVTGTESATEVITATAVSAEWS